MGGPELQIIDPNGIFLGDLFGLILSLPIALFLAFWMSSVKNRLVVVLGAFLGAFLSFLIILGWAGTLIYNSVLPGANPGNVFFGSLFLCSALGLSVGVIADLIVARMTRSDYRRSAAAAHE